MRKRCCFPLVALSVYDAFLCFLIPSDFHLYSFQIISSVLRRRHQRSFFFKKELYLIEVLRNHFLIFSCFRMQQKKVILLSGEYTRFIFFNVMYLLFLFGNDYIDYI